MLPVQARPRTPAGPPDHHVTGTVVSPTDPLMDAEALLALTSELREASRRIDASRVSEDQQRRWQRHLAGIAEGASGDLERALAQLRRFVATIDRRA